MHEFLHIPAAKGPLGPLVSWVDALIRWLCAIVLWGGFFALFLPTLANAILRYATDQSITWSVEIVQLVFPWFIMAGATLAAQHNRHIGVEFFIRLIPQKMALWVSMFVQLIILSGAFSVMYVFVGFGQFEGGINYAAGDTMFTSLQLPQSYSYMAILFGYFLLSITALTTFYRQCTGDIKVLDDRIPRDIS